MVIERPGECSAMNFDQAAFIGQFLQIPPNSIFRDIHLLAKAGRQHLIVYVHLVENKSLAFFF
jgi:hypothetical protein